MAIYLVRHGISEANLKRMAGSNLPLAASGIEQAKSIRPIIASIHADELFSSTKMRAIQTAEIATEKPTAITHLKIFDEVYFGILENASPDDGKDSSKFIPKLVDDPYLIETELGGENIFERAKVFHQFLLDYPKDKTCIIFCHDTLMRGLLTYMETGDIYGMSGFHINNCEVIQLIKNDDNSFTVNRHFGEVVKGDGSH